MTKEHRESLRALKKFMPALIGKRLLSFQLEEDGQTVFLKFENGVTVQFGAFDNHPVFQKVT